MKNSAVATDEATFARPKYYEMDGALRANANRAWLLAFLDHTDCAARDRICSLRTLAAADSDSHRPERRRLGAGQTSKRRCHRRRDRRD